jgi:Fe2+ transport system protein FeoA
MTLNNLKEQDQAVIASVANERLQSMGFRSGQSIQVLRRTPHCMHVRVGTTEWAIRDRDAELVKIIPG